MSSRTLCAFVRFAAISAAICGLALCGYIFPIALCDILGFDPNFGGAYIWLAFLLAATIPGFIILLFVWKVSTAIKRDEVFTVKTGLWIKRAAVLILADAGFFAAGNAILLFIGLSRPNIFFLSILGCLFGVSLALLAAVLSRYISKAAELQEEADGTI